MDRFALLIASSQAPGQSALPGAERDVQTLRSWLMSGAGGAWDVSEIQALVNPTIDEVHRAIATASLFDYAFVTFAGHGHHPDRGQYDRTQLVVRDGEIPARTLDCGARRCTVLVDACRGTAPEFLGAPVMLEAVKTAEDRVAYRSAFEAAALDAELGTVFMFACDVGELAGDAPRTGGYYTLALVDSARSWVDEPMWAHHPRLDTETAHSAAARAVTRMRSNQHPKYYSNPRLDHFPFAVRARV